MSAGELGQGVTSSNGRRMNHSSGRVVLAGLAAGVVLNVLGWVGNQLVLGDMWAEALASAPPDSGYQRSVANEIVSLLPDFIYGINLAWLYALIRPRLGATAVSAGISVLLIWLVGPFTTYLAITNTGWLPLPLTAASTLLALVTFVPAAWVVTRLLWNSPSSVDN